MKACPTCGWIEFDEKKRFCYRDGKILTTLPHCQNCGREYNVNHDIFCSFCGAEIVKITDPAKLETEPVKELDK